MLFRFCAALTLVILVSLAGTTLEKRNLELRRAVTHQLYQREILRERLARSRLALQEASTPARAIAAIPPEEPAISPPAPRSQTKRRPR